jgi:hypothetical protein
MSREMAQKLLSQKKNYVPQFLKQRDINSYKYRSAGLSCLSIVSCPPPPPHTFYCHILIVLTYIAVLQYIFCTTRQFLVLFSVNLEKGLRNL